MISDHLAPEDRSYRVGQVFLLATAIGWGLNWTIIKFVLHDWPPLFARGTAGLIAAAGLALVSIARRESLAVPRDAHGRLGFLAAINVFAWMGFSAVSLLWLHVAEAALITYSMPLWATLMAWPILGERPNGRIIAALAMGLTGLCILVGGPSLLQNSGKLPGVLLALAAAILFALGTLSGRKPIPMPPVALTAWQVGLGCLPMAFIGLVYERPHIGVIGVPAALGVLYMAIGPMAAFYLTWFAALRRLPASIAATGMLLVPVVGTLSAAACLGEPLGLKEFTAFAFTLGGVSLALSQQRGKGPKGDTDIASSPVATKS